MIPTAGARAPAVLVSRAVDNPSCDPLGGADYRCTETVPFGDVMCFCYRGQP